MTKVCRHFWKHSLSKHYISPGERQSRQRDPSLLLSFITNFSMETTPSCLPCFSFPTCFLQFQKKVLCSFHTVQSNKELLFCACFHQGNGLYTHLHFLVPVNFIKSHLSSRLFCISLRQCFRHLPFLSCFQPVCLFPHTPYTHWPAIQSKQRRSFTSLFIAKQLKAAWVL